MTSTALLSAGSLATRLPDFLPRQRWFGAKDRTIELVRVTHSEVMQDGWPALVRVEVDVHLTPGANSDPPGAGPADDEEPSTFQLLLGLRPIGQPAEFLTGSEAAVLGEFDTSQGQALVYDAVLDPELGLALLRAVAPDHPAERVRPVGAEQSNTSLVYDEAVILKVFRHLAGGSNPEVEVTEALTSVGFTHVPRPVFSWRRGSHDLGLLQEFLAGATEGWAMALTSLRDLYADPGNPAEAGGDFGAESQRLGEVTAELHLAMAEAFKVGDADLPAMVAGMEAQARRVLAGASLSEALEGALRVFRRVRDLPVGVPVTRVHGDYHLAQVMRTDAGWYILDFEGEPARPLLERVRPTSPLKDVAGMLRSFHYAPVVAMATQVEDMSACAAAWEARNRECFLTGYWKRMTEAETAPLPEDPVTRSAVLAAFELDKAIYEVAYERAHRPDWEPIPLEAVRRLTSAGAVR